jgi:hypothetical protein
VTRVDRVIEMVRALDAAEAEVARIKDELAEMFGEEGARAARVVSKAEAETPAPSGRAPRGERLAQVVALAKDGMEIPGIAAKLGVSAAVVRSTLLRARKKHLLPKGETNR